MEHRVRPKLEGSRCELRWKLSPVVGVRHESGRHAGLDERQYSWRRIRWQRYSRRTSHGSPPTFRYHRAIVLVYLFITAARYNAFLGLRAGVPDGSLSVCAASRAIIVHLLPTVTDWYDVFDAFHRRPVRGAANSTANPAYCTRWPVRYASLSVRAESRAIVHLLANVTSRCNVFDPFSRFAAYGAADSGCTATPAACPKWPVCHGSPSVRAASHAIASVLPITAVWYDAFRES